MDCLCFDLCSFGWRAGASWRFCVGSNSEGFDFTLYTVQWLAVACWLGGGGLVVHWPGLDGGSDTIRF